MQVPAIEAARTLRSIVHVADGNPSCPGAPLADRFHHVDLRDLEGLVEAAATISGLAAVFTAGTDFSSSAAFVAERLRLPGISWESSLNATDKGRMRTVLRTAGVAVPDHFTVEHPRDLASHGGSIRYPSVVKPVDNMGARGVRRANDFDELACAVRDALPFSRNGRVIVEQFISGQEYSLDAILTEDSAHVTGVAERHIFFPPHFVEMGHTIPAALSDEDRSLLESEFIRAARALGITRGAAKGDIFLDHTGGRKRAVVGEVAARLSGGYMSGWTYPLATGVPLTELGLRVALGETPGARDFEPSRALVVAERALISCPGTVRSVETVPGEREEGIEHVFIRCAPGDWVHPPANNVEKVANVIAAGNTMEEAEDRAVARLDRILVRLETGNRETEQFLFSPFGTGPFRRYDPAGEDALSALSSLPWFSGDDDELHELCIRGEPVPVVSPDGTDLVSGFVTRYPAAPAWKLLKRLEEAGTITVQPAGAGSRALGQVFWRAFCAAGRQGVVYVLDSLRERTMPQEDRR